MGQIQVNMTWHNTLATVGHFHATVALGTTLAFFGLVLFVIKTMFRRDFVSDTLASAIPYAYGAAMSVATLMLMYAGILRCAAPDRRSRPEHPDRSSTSRLRFRYSRSSGSSRYWRSSPGLFVVVVSVGSLLFGDRLAPGDDGGMLPDGGLHADGRRSDPRGRAPAGRSRSV